MVGIAATLIWIAARGLVSAGGLVPALRRVPALLGVTTLGWVAALLGVATLLGLARRWVSALRGIAALGWVASLFRRISGASLGAALRFLTTALVLWTRVAVIGVLVARPPLPRTAAIARVVSHWSHSWFCAERLI